MPPPYQYLDTKSFDTFKAALLAMRPKFVAVSTTESTVGSPPTIITALTARFIGDGIVVSFDVGPNPEVAALSRDIQTIADTAGIAFYRGTLSSAECAGAAETFARKLARDLDLARDREPPSHEWTPDSLDGPWPER